MTAKPMIDGLNTMIEVLLISQKMINEQKEVQKL
jgi:hypothetical protein